MKRMTKIEALARIATLLDGKIIESAQERTSARYLTLLSHALAPLADDEPVDTIASQFLLTHFELFTETANDEKHLAELPQLFLAMDAHIFVLNENKKSVLSRLIEENKIKADTYFITHYFVPFLQQHWHAQVIIPAGQEITFFRTLIKSNLMTLLREYPTIFATEKLAASHGRETLLSHLLKIGSKSFTVHSSTTHHKEYVKHLSQHALEREIFEDAFRKCQQHPTPLAFNHAFAVDSPTIPLPFLTENMINKSIAQTVGIIKDLPLFKQTITQMSILCASTKQLENTLRNTLYNGFLSHHPERQFYLGRVQALLELGIDPHCTVSTFANYLSNQSKSHSANGNDAEYPDDFFRLLFQCSLFDVETNPGALLRLPLTTLMPILFKALSFSPDKSCAQLRRVYHRAITNNPGISPVFTATYLAVKSHPPLPFFGFSAACFKERVFVVAENNDAIASIIQNSYFFHSISHAFKDRLFAAITHLPITDQHQLRGLNQIHEPTLAVALLTSTHGLEHGTATEHYERLLGHLKAPTPIDMDSSEDEDPVLAIPFEETPASEEDIAKIHAFKALHPSEQIITVYEALLDFRLSDIALFVTHTAFSINSTLDWIHFHPTHHPRVTVNAAGPGTLLHKLWIEDEKTLPVQKKLLLTEFLISQGLSIFTTIELTKENFYNYFNFATFCNLPQLTDYLIHAIENGFVERFFHKIPIINFPAMLLMFKKIGPNEDNQLLPIFFTVYFLLHDDRNKKAIPLTLTPALFRNQFLQPLSKEQAAGLYRILNTYNRYCETTAALISMAQSLINEDPAFRDELFELKRTKTPCAFFTILKQQKQGYYLYSPSSYTLFKRDTWPKAKQPILESSGPPSAVAHLAQL